MEPRSVSASLESERSTADEDLASSTGKKLLLMLGDIAGSALQTEEATTIGVSNSHFSDDKTERHGVTM